MIKEQYVDFMKTISTDMEKNEVIEAAFFQGALSVFESMILSDKTDVMDSLKEINSEIMSWSLSKLKE